MKNRSLFKILIANPRALLVSAFALFLFLLPASADGQNAAAKPYFDRGYEQYENGQYEAAIRNFTLAVNEDPQAYLAYYNRGLAQNKLGNYDAAIADYTRAILINPQYVNAIYGRALAKYKKGDNDGAIADSNDAIRLRPGYADAYYNRGNAYYQKKDFANAVTDYSETIRLNPGYANAYYGRGSSRKMLGDAQGALSDYEKAVELDPGLHTNVDPFITELRAQVSGPASPSSRGTQDIVFGAPRLYEHKSGWFSLSIPDNWKISKDTTSEDEAILSLADPTENAVVVVRVYAPTRGYTQSELGDVLKSFINERMGTFDSFAMGDVRTQKDGSLGVAFKYNQPIKDSIFPMVGDAFIEQHNGLIGVLALIMPKDQYDAKQTQAYAMLNSFRVIGVRP